MRINKVLLIGIPAIFIFAVLVVLFGPGPESEPMVKVRMIAVKADRSDEEDLARARKKIDEIYQALENGGDFIKLAKEKSEAESARQGGDMGWRGKGTLPPNQEDAVFQLEPGQHSEIIEDVTIENVIYRILYVEDRRNF